MSAPLVYRWEDGAMHPMGRFARQAHDQFEPGETYFLGEIEERSEVSHNHQFAWLKDAWASLPEDLGAKYPSKEHLRKAALIHTGWCTIRDYPCQSRAEAQRLAVAIRGLVDEYAVILVQDAVVRLIEARSQARGKMKPADFQKSKQSILEWVAALLEVTPASLSGGPTAQDAAAMQFREPKATEGTDHNNTPSPPRSGVGRKPAPVG